jgi:glycosyltransferase involved in cell wall biosynthesis
VVLCTPGYDTLYGATFFSLARWLARLGARVDIVTPWGTLAEISASLAEDQPMGLPDGRSEVEKFMTDGAIDEYDLIVTPDPKVTHPLVVNRRLREGTRLAITDFHMLGGMSEWVRDLRVPGRRPEEGGWWPSKQIMLYSAFPGYAPLYTRYGIPMRQVAWQPYALDPERFPAELPATAGKTIISAGHHKRDLDTLLSAAARLGSHVHPIDLFAPGEVPNVPRQIRFRGTVPPPAFCPEVGRSRFMVVPVVADPHIAAGITAFVTAIIYGRPLVVTDTAGARDYVVDGVNGLLVPPRDPQSLAAAIERLDTDPDLLAKLAAGAREAASHFTTEAWARALLHGTRNYDPEHWMWTKWSPRLHARGGP